MTINAAKAYAEIQKVVAGEGDMDAGWKKVAASAKLVGKEQQEMGRAAKRVLRDIQTPQERYNTKLKELGQLLKARKIDQDQYARAVGVAKQKLDAAGRAGKSAFGGAMLTQVKQLGAALGLGGGVAGVLTAVVTKYDAVIERMQRVSKEATTAANAQVAFAALQAPGTKGERARKVATLAGQYGVEYDVAYNAVQALQSAQGGDFEKGMSTAEVVFGAKRMNVPVERGLEMELLGIGQGATPGDTIRRAYVAGTESKRDPAALSLGGAGLKYWANQVTGIAAATVLAGENPENQLPTALKRAGEGLSRTGPLQDEFEAWGMANATQIERISELSRRGLDIVQLQEMGMSESVEREAVADLVRKYADMKRYVKAIQERAKPGLFVSERAGVEAEIPQVKQAGILERLVGRMTYADTMTQAAVDAQKVVGQQLATVTAMKEHNVHEGLLGLNYYSGDKEDSRAGSTWAFRAALNPAVGPFKVKQIKERAARILHEASSTPDQLDREAILESQLLNEIAGGLNVGRLGVASGLRDSAGQVLEARGITPERQAELAAPAEQFATAVAVFAEVIGNIAGGGPTLAKPDEDR